jgi:hypothetical protein
MKVMIETGLVPELLNFLLKASVAKDPKNKA